MCYNTAMNTLATSLKSFDSFKFFMTLFFFVSAFFLPVLSLVFFIVIALGKSHSMGAWLGMWRAKKMNWRLFSWILFVTICVSYWGTQLASFKTVALVSSFFFLFHYLFDEMIFHSKKDTNSTHSFFSGLVPFFLVSLFLFSDFLGIKIQTELYISLFLFFLACEILFSKISWFFFETKIISLFLIFSIFFDKGTTFVFIILLFSHYFFWLILPIYKLHLYKPEERDSFAIIILLISITSVFIYSSRVWGAPLVAPAESFLVRGFYIASLVHVLTTAPFAYLFGLRRPTYSNE